MTASLSIVTQEQGTVQSFVWNYQNCSFKVIYETFGLGNPVLLLPAFSTVSSRTEMTQIAQLLALNYQVTVLDWLGFGDSEKPNLDYNPEIYQQLLADFVNNCFKEPLIIIASGHASGYALKVAQTHPHLIQKIGLIAPTWRGPLKVMGIPSIIRKGLKNLVRTPILGQFLYYLNTTPAFLHFMYRRHVYVDQTKLTPDFISQKRQITQQEGARFAPVAFVTGIIDPFNERSEVLSLISGLSQPILIIIAEQSPPYSKREMEAISQLANVTTVRVSGTLGVYEEYAEEVSQEIKNFLGIA
jgi:pimeloyl-ACP methyl ester carboxylesterase